MRYLFIFGNSTELLQQDAKAKGYPTVAFDNGFKIPVPIGFGDGLMNWLSKLAKEYGQKVNFTIA